MEAHFGPTGWWPGETPFEVAVGAVLTQNTNWTNVEKAIEAIQTRRAMAPRALYRLSEEALADLLRPTGYFRVKARRLRAFLKLIIEEHDGDFDALLRRGRERLRRTLLAVNGIGPETADDIVLYAAGYPVFVVDAYTRRIFERHGLLRPGMKYEEIRDFFESALPRRTKLYKEYHALVVYTGKQYCRKSPRCEACPLAAVRPITIA